MFETLVKSKLNQSFEKLPQIEKQQLNEYGLTETIIAILALTVNFSNLFFVRK